MIDTLDILITQTQGSRISEIDFDKIEFARIFGLVRFFGSWYCDRDFFKVNTATFLGRLICLKSSGPE